MTSQAGFGFEGVVSSDARNTLLAANSTHPANQGEWYTGMLPAEDWMRPVRRAVYLWLQTRPDRLHGGSQQNDCHPGFANARVTVQRVFV